MTRASAIAAMPKNRTAMPREGRRKRQRRALGPTAKRLRAEAAALALACVMTAATAAAPAAAAAIAAAAAAAAATAELELEAPMRLRLKRAADGGWKVKKRDNYGPHRPVLHCPQPPSAAVPACVRRCEPPSAGSAPH